MAKILLTGGSSFSGLWIAQALADAGHQVTAAVTRPKAAYQGLRAERVARLEASTQVVFEAPIASPDAIFGSHFRFCASLPASISASAAR